jgi:hypothetical protein
MRRFLICFKDFVWVMGVVQRLPMLGTGVLSVIACLSIVCSVLVRWFGGSFGFFSIGLCVEKNTNVPPNALANFFLSLGYDIKRLSYSMSNEGLYDP